MILSGIYSKTLYKNNATGQTIFAFRPDDQSIEVNPYGCITCVGVLPYFLEKTPIEVDCNYGIGNEPYQITEISEYSNNKELSISFLTQYLDGIGEVSANRIIDIIGVNLFTEITNEMKEQLLCVRGMDERKVNDLIDKLSSTKTQRKLLSFLSSYQVNYAQIMKLYELYSETSFDMIIKNPYITGFKAGFEFPVCDKIAYDQGFSPIHEQRFFSLIYHILNNRENQGHLYSTFQDIMEQIQFFEKRSVFSESLPKELVLFYLAKHPSVIIEKGTPNRYYKKETWEKELSFVKNIKRLTLSNKPLPFQEDLISYSENVCNVTYGISQRKAFSLLKSTGIKLLIGNPGTGKTTTINGLITVYEKMFPTHNIVICAPTGRAAQRIKETSGREAKTMHRQIEYREYGEKQVDLTPIEANFIIIDEMSMADLEIMSYFLQCIKNDTLVLLVGDDNQLPSVGAGNILHDMIDSNCFETYRLDQIYRQKENSLILENLEKIKTQNTFLRTNDKFHIMRMKNEHELETQAVSLFYQYFQKENPFSTQILSPIKKNKGGVYSINQVIQQNYYANQKEKLVFGKRVYYVGDKVIFLKTDYKKGYFNGDIGEIKEIYNNKVMIDINNITIEIEGYDMEQVSLAYDITIHKSQGSEFPVVIIPLPLKARGMLQKNLLYTAVSRAKDKVIILSEQDALEQSILSNTMSIRDTITKEKLKGETYELIKNDLRYSSILAS